MKRISLVLLGMIFFIGCGNDLNYITLSSTKVSMAYNATKTLTISYSSKEIEKLTYIFSSSDEDIVTVSSTGIVSGVSLGTATISAISKNGKYKDDCKFTITPLSTLYTEPFVVFGSSENTVVTNETRTKISQDTACITYTDTNPAIKEIKYYFENNHLVSVAVFLVGTPANIAEATTFLSERYESLGISNGIDFYKQRKTKAKILFSNSDTSGLYIMYLPPDPGLNLPSTN